MKLSSARKFRYALALAALFCVSNLSAQLMEVTDATTAPITPENLITNIFLGDGVEVVDVVFEGDPLAVGYFKNGDNAVGINRGIVLTSGRSASTNCNVPDLGGADCTGGDFTSFDNASNATDPDLSAIAAGGLSVLDVAKFTITFIPTSDTLRFRYVFASEEYPEYACSPFNDVFGFFISGPGINGTFQNNGINIAQIPGTTTPVTINNIHPANGPQCPPAFQQFYNNNNGGGNQPTYDGILDVFIAEVVVIPCQTYTIKLSLADVGDPAFDTGVFLEAKSFGTGSLQVETATVSLDGTITEDCASGSITFTSAGPVEADFPLGYTIIGTAQNGVDYLTIPLDLFIPQGDSMVTLDIVGIEDGIPEGLESIGIDIQRDVCNRDTFWVFIRDNEIVPPNLGPDTAICSLQSVQLDATLPIPLPVPPSFTNPQDYVVTSTAPTYSPLQVVGVQPVTLQEGVIQSVCVNVDHNWVDDVDLFLLSPGGQFIELSSDNGANCDDYTNVCFTPINTNSIGAGFPWPACTSGGQPSFANGTFAPEGVWTDLWDGDYPTNGTWQLLAIDDQMGFNGTILDWTITFEPLYQIYYAWSPTDGLSCTDCPDPVATPQQTTTYTVTASDTYGCTVQDSITITVMDVLPAPNVNCSDVTNNSITFSWDAVAGATMGYLVSINGGPLTQNNGTTEILNGLTLDEEFTIEVFAIGECDGLLGTATCSTPPCNAPGLSIANVTNVTCNGDTNGAVTLQASGGAGDYVYTFNGVNNLTGVYTGIAAGTYTATVLDSWACPNNIQVTISAPQMLDVQPVVVNAISCSGLSDATLAAPTTGGTAPYSFAWSSGQTDSLATNFAAGNQTVTVMDANGCSATATINVTEPMLLTLTTAVDSADCAGTATGGALVIIAGGTAPHSVLWSAGTNNATTALVNNLAAGSYPVTVTDDNGCTATATASIAEPSPVTGSITPTDPSCNGTATGTATATATGGTGSYDFFWSNGDFGPMADTLSATVYTVTIADAYGCTGTASATLTDPPGISLALSPTDAICFGANNGGISTSATGGTAPLGFLWDNGSTSASLPSLPAGDYCLTVTDGGGCTATACATVAQPTDLVLAAEPTNANCNGINSGEIDLTVSGGTAPYDYLWSTSATTEDLTGLAADTYDVTVTDASGCSSIAQATLLDNAALSSGFENENVKCKGEATGVSLAVPAGGSAPYSFLWSNGLAANPISDVTAGGYDLTITDANGCSAVFGTAVTEPSDSLRGVLELDYVSCFGEMDGRIGVIAVGGTGPYQYSLDSAGFGGSTAFNGLDFGLYDLSIQDANGCIWEQRQIYIGEPKELRVSLGPDTILPYGTVLLLDPNISNLTDPSNALFYWYSNNPGMQPKDSTSRIGEFLVISQASVTFAVVDENGCTAEDLINIFVRAEREVVVPTGFAPGTGGPALNDLLHVHGKAGLVKEVKLFRIFDRWGELLYEAANFPINDPGTGWDGTFEGKEMPAGVYAWYLEVVYVDGAAEAYRGEVTLVR